MVCGLLVGDECGLLHDGRRRMRGGKVGGRRERRHGELRRLRSIVLPLHAGRHGAAGERARGRRAICCLSPRRAGCGPQLGVAVVVVAGEIYRVGIGARCAERRAGEGFLDATGGEGGHLGVELDVEEEGKGLLWRKRDEIWQEQMADIVQRSRSSMALLTKSANATNRQHAQV